ncbi:unnamed protein product [Phytophthora lilii]|uniref:Elicitin n=1 Tax=Phytophthora lilii TaxID=2077276 RepID=A0A9W6X7R4_9STRA|nr:unnamed protein product [Phytophthora lilii]
MRRALARSDCHARIVHSPFYRAPPTRQTRSMRGFSFTVSAVLLLNISSVLAAKKCSASVSDPITSKIDDGVLFSTCALGDAGLYVDSLFGVLNFSQRDFLIFCRAPRCTEPIKSLVHSIPTDCLIPYHGSARNLSEEVSTLYLECAQVVGAADKTDEDYVYRYFLD